MLNANVNNASFSSNKMALYYILKMSRLKRNDINQNENRE